MVCTWYCLSPSQDTIPAGHKRHVLYSHHTLNWDYITGDNNVGVEHPTDWDWDEKKGRLLEPAFRGQTAPATSQGF